MMGFLDDNDAFHGTRLLGLPVLGPIDVYRELASTGLVMGIGDNAARKAIVERLGTEIPHPWHGAIHPTATIAPSVQIGEGTVVAAGAVINPDTIIGKHAIINTGATIDHDCKIGDFCHIAPGAHLAGGIHVGEGSLIGIGVVATPYHSIGAWVVVGAGAVVIRDIPDRVVAKGVPARWESA
jgi:sugar O-acyltransferase (sialic acid O-acetyltransferase NeuD family)